ncbi:MAG: hypothetical protein A3K19_18465 [Lentisphaerae bacterium RIFOXYB12_FULL_65_16]|nr:MAG: hypothetical protein A3K18_13820 [Lentisphaerae bacterium RIFOXYA12_64_32]OGV92946.1 MAG: hypothetical protein A3K19_18465 [Lentisphaerae bacterium RIFOXYB12_FULL_65_16]
MFATDRLLSGFTALVVLSAVRLAAQPAPAVSSTVTVRDAGPTYRQQSWIDGHKDHKWEQHEITLDNGKACYAVKYTACVDPSHPDTRALEEGYIGMPSPCAANWYHSGFFFIKVNGTEIGVVPLADMRITETGARGGCHMVWDTPDATVRVQFLVLPGGDRLLSQVTWTVKPGRTVTAVSPLFRCYPSFFTSHHRRQGDRTVTTPRAGKHEPETLDLVPAEDTFLLYTDGVFDVAKKEGDGPCAMIFLPEEIASGKVQLTNYPVTTSLEANPETKRLRFTFWDFAGKTNAEALAYLQANAAKMQEELRTIDFRPETMAKFDPGATKAEADKLLAGAGEDAAPFKPRTEKLVTQMTDLKAKAEAGAWDADAEFAKLAPEFETLLWKLKIFALLNAP